MGQVLRALAGDRPWFIRMAVVAGLAVLGFAIYLTTGPGPLDFKRTPPVGAASVPMADPTGVPASLAQASLVVRGEYLAKAADCVVCHTARGGAPFAGGLGIRLPFGTLYSSNITPDRRTGIGSYTDSQFLAAVRRGVRPDGAHLYPAMPVTSYRYLTDADALAIKAYLFSQQPVSARAKANQPPFPFNQRWVMGIWLAMFNPDRHFTPDIRESARWNRGAYLAEALAHCGECHTPRNLAFALDNRRKFGGAITAGWHAYNISSDRRSGIGAWQDTQVLAYLSVGHAQGHGTAAGPMGEAVDESFSKLAPEDLRALLVYLRTIPAVAELTTGVPAVQTASLWPLRRVDTTDRGRKIYEEACVGCHGLSGDSPISPYATLTGARAVNDPQGTNVAQIVINGMIRTTPADIPPMPPFGTVYSDADIAAVVNFITGRFGTVGATLDGGDIAKLRRQTAQ
jgi:mono/diheme cytochrome c family protein